MWLPGVPAGLRATVPSPGALCDPIPAALSQLPPEARGPALDVTHAWVRAVSQLPPAAAATPPIRCADTWVSFWDDAPPMLTVPLLPPSYARRGPHEPWLLRSSSPDIHVLSSVCAMCGKMRASVAAVHAPQDAAPQPRLFCVAQSAQHPLLTADVANRAHLWDGSQHYTGGVALFGSRWARCLGLPPPATVLPVPTWALRLPPPDAPQATPEPVSFWATTWR